MSKDKRFMKSFKGFPVSLYICALMNVFYITSTRSLIFRPDGFSCIFNKRCYQTDRNELHGYLVRSKRVDITAVPRLYSVTLNNVSLFDTNKVRNHKRRFLFSVFGA